MAPRRSAAPLPVPLVPEPLPEPSRCPSAARELARAAAGSNIPDGLGPVALGRRHSQPRRRASCCRPAPSTAVVSSRTRCAGGVEIGESIAVGCGRGVGFTGGRLTTRRTCARVTISRWGGALAGLRGITPATTSWTAIEAANAIAKRRRFDRPKKTPSQSRSIGSASR